MISARSIAVVATLLAVASSVEGQARGRGGRSTVAAGRGRANAPPDVVLDSIPFKAPVRVCFGGDVTLGTNLDPAWAKKAADSLRARFDLAATPDSLVAALRPFVRDADLVLLNVEGAIGNGPAPRKCSPKSTACFAFRSDSSAAAALRSVSGFESLVVGNVANNHAHDAGGEGRDSSVAHLTRAGVVVTGADTLATLVITERGDTLAFLGFHTSKDSPDARDLAAVRRHVERAAREYGTVIVTMHLGAEGAGAERTRNADERFVGEQRGNPVAFANAAFSGGATMVVGHGPHVLRAGEWRGDRLVLYSLGNLLTFGPFKLREPLNVAAVACATITGRGRVTDAELRATRQLAPGVLVADSAKRAFAIVDSLSRLDFPKTGVSVSSTGFLRPRKQ